jgi:argininosuccinate lyase
MSSDAAALLETPPHPLLTELLYEPGLRDDLVHTLPYLLRIDAAHIVMLVHSGLLAEETGARLLRENRALAARQAGGVPVFGEGVAHRGLYLLLERHYQSALGPEIGGAGHLARSRNDINATVARMRARDAVLALMTACVELQQTLAAVAGRHTSAVMSGFTHAQPAQPTTFAHYLAGVLSEVTRSARWLSDVYAAINRCPMGAAAGFGTSLPIDRATVAALLGFDEVVPNALDAVASRDYAVQVLAALATLASTLSRMSVDLQTWGSRAYGFLAWPDHLVSTSSIMPQKRNAFVLEHIRGAAPETSAALIAVITGLKNTPFTNSVEVSAETTRHLWGACAAMRRSLRLATVLVAAVTVDEVRMRAFVEGEETTMTALADWLVVEHGRSFRAAHTLVSRVVAECVDRPLRPSDVCRALRRLTSMEPNGPVEVSDARVAAVLRPDTCVRAARFGGGPAPEAVEAQLADLRAAADAGREAAADRRRRLDQADVALAEEVRRITGGRDEEKGSEEKGSDERGGEERTV